MNKIKAYSLSWLLLACSTAFAMDNTQMGVWANEAIIATYTYDYKDFLAQQKQIAKYFTADGWVAFSKAMTSSNLPSVVDKNKYIVSAVATLPPQIKALDAKHWQATMPVLVIYKNDQSQQKQTLNVRVIFTTVPDDQGVRGLAIMSFITEVAEPPCECTAGTSSLPSEVQSKPQQSK